MLHCFSFHHDQWIIWVWSRFAKFLQLFIYISTATDHLAHYWPAFNKRQVRVNWCKHCNRQCFAQRARFCVLNVGNLFLSHLIFQRILKSSQFLAGSLRLQHFLNPSFPESIIFCNLLYSSILIMHRVVRALRVVFCHNTTVCRGALSCRIFYNCLFTYPITMKGWRVGRFSLALNSCKLRQFFILFNPKCLDFMQ